MTQRQVKAKIFDLIKTYFAKADVIWSKSGAVKPRGSLVALTVVNVSRPYAPIVLNVDGIKVDCYPSAMNIQIDLFTKGAIINDAIKTTSARENTAVNDMISFVNFMNSQYVLDWSMVNDISIVISGPVHELTDLNSDDSWEYRSMIEVNVGFTDKAVGYTGMDYEDGIGYGEDGKPIFGYDEDGNPINNPPSFVETPSGGGSQELADTFTGWFNQVDGPSHKEEKQ